MMEITQVTHSYQLACALQNHLKKKNINWKIVHSDGFQKFNHVLDKLIQESIRMVQKTSSSKKYWIWKHTVGNKCSTWWRFTWKISQYCFILVGVNNTLRVDNEHYCLCTPGECITSQLSFEHSSVGVRCLMYREDNITKTNRGGLKDMKRERKIVWIKPSKNINHCWVRIVEKYLKLLPKTGVKPSLYLNNLKKTKPTVWYCETPLGINKVRDVVSTVLKDTGLDGFSQIIP